MTENRVESEKLGGKAGHSDMWGQIAANAYNPNQSKARPEVVTKPVVVNGETIVFPVTICPPGSASGLEKPKPRPIVQGGACSPRQTDV